MAQEQATTEPFVKRFWALMRCPITTWDRVTRASWVFTIFYVIAILLLQPKWTSSWGGFEWPEWARDIANAGLAVAIMIISVWYGGILTDFYSKLTGFGISEVRQDRRGADSQSTTLWMDRISGAEKVQIVGTLSRGWFVVAYDNLDNLLNTNDKIKLDVFLLDPFGKVWRSKIESEQDDYGKFSHEADQVLWNLHELMGKYPNRVKVRLYDSEPISCVIARGAIYLGLYLPRTSRKTIPEFSISSGSFLGNKVIESMSRIENCAPAMTVDAIKGMRNTIVSHISATKERFWSDPLVFCDFCKELRRFPSEVSRRHPEMIEGSRIAFQDDNFFIVPSLGPLVESHALIVSTNHLTSSARLSSGAFSQLTEIFNKLLLSAEQQEKTQLFFEHGVPDDSGGHGGCGICHCHVHSLSILKDYNPLAKLEKFLNDKKCQFEKKEIESWERLEELAERSYLCVQVGKMRPTVFIFNRGERIESQLMRQFVAEDYPESDKEWDWRKKSKKSTAITESTGDRRSGENEKNQLHEEQERILAANANLKKIFI
jgi:hypothetical protein